MNPDSEPAPDRTMTYDDGRQAKFKIEKNGPRYSLSNLHAVGGIGEIWLALDLDRDVAVAQAEQKATTFEAKAVHADSTTRWVSWNVTPIARGRAGTGLPPSPAH